MAQTIKELEEERASLLEAIDNKAQKMSFTRSGSSKEESSEHTLKDWLNAAEDVMPSKPKPQNKTSPDLKTSAEPSKFPFFGVIIIFSLLLTILGVVYIAYISIQNELKQVMSVKESSVTEMKTLQESINKLEQAVASKGQGELFSKLQAKVDSLAIEVNLLKENQTKVIADKSSISANQETVTPAVLEQKLREFSEGIDAKLEKILQRLNQTSQPSKQSKQAVAEPKMLEPLQPIQPSVKQVKPLNQPVVRLIKRVETPKEPKVASAPIVNYTADVKWLIEQPTLNYTLQLASMPNKSDIQNMIRTKSLEGAKVIPQQRSASTNYVLISGSYPSRKAANEASKKYKANFGITPWVRSIKHLSERVK